MNDIANIIIDDFKIEETKRKLASYVAEGRLDQKVIQLLVSGRNCIPLECELLDYKQELQDEKIAQAKALVSIVSMYNTYGGYIVYGVAERRSETEFEVVGIKKNSLDVERLKALAKEYTGERIQLTLQYFSTPISDSGVDANQIGLLYIPKRTHHEPLCFGKRGPEDVNKKTNPFLSKKIFFIEKGMSVFWRRAWQYLLSQAQDPAHMILRDLQLMS